VKLRKKKAEQTIQAKRRKLMAEYDEQELSKKTMEQIEEEQKEEQKKLAQLLPKAQDSKVHVVR
jgi:hypothetical protein